jgi:hypothetical protein
VAAVITFDASSMETAESKPTVTTNSMQGLQTLRSSPPVERRDESLSRLLSVRQCN